MPATLPTSYRIKPEVSQALHRGSAVVALESAVITHGLPYPQNMELALSVEELLQTKNVTPATVGLVNGRLCVGLKNDEIHFLASTPGMMKVSSRDVGIGIATARSGGTTVAATLLAARNAGIQVFATGGIGGVHHGNSTDNSADLDELARSCVIVVCAGAKAILNLPATLEALETRGIPVLGYKTDDFPAFYSRTSGLRVDAKVENSEIIVKIARAHWLAGNSTAVLVVNPIPEEFALNNNIIETAVQKSVKEAHQEGIHGSDLTPYLLDAVRAATSGKSVAANLALLRNNVNLAAEIALAMSKPNQVKF